VIRQLTFTASEMLRALNAVPEQHDPAVNTKRAHLIPARLNLDETYFFSGVHVHQQLGSSQWSSRTHHAPPTRNGSFLALREPLLPNGQPAAERLSGPGLAPAAPLGKTHLNSLAQARYSVLVSSVQLRRLHDLSADTIGTLGVRQDAGQWTFSHTGPSSPSPQDALIEWWDSTVRAELSSENPYVWVIGWEEVVAHLGSAEKLRTIEQLLKCIQPLDVQIAALSKELAVLQRQRQVHAVRAALLMRLEEDPSLTINLAGYTVSGHHVRPHQPLR